MPTLDNPTPFTEAVKFLADKKAVPSSMGSAEWRQVQAGIKNSSLFSARVLNLGVLDAIQTTVKSVLNPGQELRPGGNMATVGFDPASARLALMDTIEAEGYKAPEGKEGTIEDLHSSPRIDLIVKTNTATAQGAGHYVQQNANADVVDLWPALEFLDDDSSEVPRGEKQTKDGLVEDPENSWEARWEAALEDSGDDDAQAAYEATGRKVALKSSGVWESLGEGAGGWTDNLDNPFPPFAFNSTRRVQELSRDEAEELGLLDEGEAVDAPKMDWSALFRLPAEAEAIMSLFANEAEDQPRDADGKVIQTARFNAAPAIANSTDGFLARMAARFGHKANDQRDHPLHK